MSIKLIYTDSTKIEKEHVLDTFMLRSLGNKKRFLKFFVNFFIWDYMNSWPYFL